MAGTGWLSSMFHFLQSLYLSFKTQPSLPKEQGQGLQKGK